MMCHSRADRVSVPEQIHDIRVTLNDCRRQEFSVTAYTAVTNFKSAVNSDREYKRQDGRGSKGG